MEEIEDEIKRMLLPLIQKQGYELVDLKLKGSGPPSVLRIYVDKAGGITLDECARLSKKLSDYLDTLSRGEEIPVRKWLIVGLFILMIFIAYLFIRTYLFP